MEFGNEGMGIFFGSFFEGFVFFCGYPCLQ
jgi:hypothetical protein